MAPGHGRRARRAAWCRRAALRERRGPSRAAWALLGLGVLLRLDVARRVRELHRVRGVSRAARAWRSAAEGSALLAVSVLGRSSPSECSTTAIRCPNTFYLKATGAPIADVLANGGRQIWGMLTPLSPVLLAVALAGGWLLRRDPLLRARGALRAGALRLRPRRGRRLAQGLSQPLPGSGGGALLRAPRGRGQGRARALASGAAPGRAARGGSRWRRSRCWAPSRSTRRSPPGSGCGRRSRRSGGRRTARTRASRSTCASRRRPAPASRSTPPGRPATSLQRPTLDVLGKSDRHIAKLPVRFFHPGHSKWDWDYMLLERRPDVIVDTSRGLERHPELAPQLLPGERRRTASSSTCARIGSRGCAITRWCSTNSARERRSTGSRRWRSPAPRPAP